MIDKSLELESEIEYDEEGNIITGDQILAIFSRTKRLLSKLFEPFSSWPS